METKLIFLKRIFEIGDYVEVKFGAMRGRGGMVSAKEGDEYFVVNPRESLAVRTDMNIMGYIPLTYANVIDVHPVYVPRHTQPVITRHSPRQYTRRIIR